MPKNEEVSLASLGIQMPYSMQAEQSVLGGLLLVAGLAACASAIERISVLASSRVSAQRLNWNRPLRRSGSPERNVSSESTMRRDPSAARTAK